MGTMRVVKYPLKLSKNTILPLNDLKCQILIGY